MTDQTTNTILQALHRVCADLSGRRFLVCSIVPGNASHEIAAPGDLRTGLSFPVFMFHA
jgi:hypothetical protein